MIDILVSCWQQYRCLVLRSDAELRRNGKPDLCGFFLRNKIAHFRSLSERKDGIVTKVQSRATRVGSSRRLFRAWGELGGRKREPMTEKLQKVVRSADEFPFTTDIL